MDFSFPTVSLKVQQMFPNNSLEISILSEDRFLGENQIN